jgi:hypothetical protein
MGKFVQISEIEDIGECETIDITTSGNNLFFANGILTHNSGITSQIGEITFAMLSESIGTAATADFIMVLGNDSDSLVYQNEIFYKILKNRLGGRVGEISKFYQDDKSLKMYDSVELDNWISDASISGACVNMAN